MLVVSYPRQLTGCALQKQSGMYVMGDDSTNYILRSFLFT
jgi:hypothetical protein